MNKQIKKHALMDMHSVVKCNDENQEVPALTVVRTREKATCHVSVFAPQLVSEQIRGVLWC